MCGFDLYYSVTDTDCIIESMQTFAYNFGKNNFYPSTQLLPYFIGICPQFICHLPLCTHPSMGKESSIFNIVKDAYVISASFIYVTEITIVNV